MHTWADGYFRIMFYFVPVPPPVGTCCLGALLHLKSSVVLLRQQDEGQSFSAQHARSVTTVCHLRHRFPLPGKQHTPFSSFFSRSCSVRRGLLIPSHGKPRSATASGNLFPLCLLLYFIEILSLPLFQRKDTLFILELCSRQLHNWENS